MDADGDGTIDCELIGEQAYGGTDVWMNKDAWQIPGSNLADDFDETFCSDYGPAESYGTGSGDYRHGTLDHWAAALNRGAYIYEHELRWCNWEGIARAAINFCPEPEIPASVPDVARVLEEGIGASGLVQGGVMKRVGLGPENYYFGYPSTAAVSGPCAAVSGSYTFTRNIRTQQGRHGGRFVFTTGGTCANQTVTWKVKIGRHVVKKFVQHAGGRSPFRFVNTNTHDAKTLTVTRNGVRQASYTFDPAPKG